MRDCSAEYRFVDLVLGIPDERVDISEEEACELFDCLRKEVARRLDF